MSIRKLGALLCAVLMIVTCVGCAPEPVNVDKDKLTLATTTTTTTRPIVQDGTYNPLTGEYDITDGAGTRPVALMIGNNDKSRPQYGIDQADLIVEMETEGGITRLMAVFTGAEQIPAQIGPNRSARTPFVKIATALDAIYSHAGGSEPAKALLATKIIDEIDALGYDGTAYWRDAGLRASKGLEYSMMTSGENIAGIIQKQGFRTTTDRLPPYDFATPIGTNAGEKVQVKFSTAQTISFVYNAETGTYTKSNGTLANGSEHTTADGGVITAKNIFVIYAKKVSEGNGITISFDFDKGGAGCAISGGKSREITWEMSNDGLIFREQNGSVAAAAPGKSYICVVSNAVKNPLVLE